MNSKRARSLFLAPLFQILGFFFLGGVWQALHFGAPFLDFLKFFSFEVFALVLPAHLLAPLVFRGKRLAPITRFFFLIPVLYLGYFVAGWGGAYFKVPYAQLALTLSIFVLSFIRLKIKVFSFELREGDEEDRSLLVLAGATFLVFLALSSLWLWRLSLAPQPGGEVRIYPDQLWNLGNIWSILRGGFPLSDSRVAGVTLSYHLVQGFFHAYAVRLTGLHPLWIQNWFCPLFDQALLIVGLINLLKWVFKFSLSQIVWTVLGIYFAKGLGEDYFNHLLWHPLTFFFSLFPFFVFLSLSFLKFTSEEEISGVNFALVCSFLCLFATKSLAPAFCLPALFLSVLRLRVKKGFFSKGTVREVGMGLILALGLLAIRAMIYSNPRGVWIDSVVETSRVFGFMQVYLGFFPRLLLSGLFGLYLVITRGALCFLSVAGLGILTAFLGRGQKPRFQSEAEKSWVFFMAVLFLAAVSSEQFFKFSFSGPSIYFRWYAGISLFIIAGLFVKPLFADRISKAIVWGGLTVGLGLFCYLRVLEVPRGLADERRAYDPRSSVSYDEWITLEWIQKNTDPMSILASEKKEFSVPEKKPLIARCFDYSAISGRQMFLEGNAFLEDKDFEDSEAAWQKWTTTLAQRNGDLISDTLSAHQVDYLFISKRLGTGPITDSPKLHLVFSTPTTEVFKVRND